jgi:nucleotide-binding universal stress UspA family protein
MTPKKILLVVNYSPDCDRAIDQLLKRQWPSGTTIRVLAVVDNTPPSAAELFFDAGGNLDEVMKARKERAEELALQEAEKLRQIGLGGGTSVRTGRRRKEIVAEKKSWVADVILQP